MLDVEVTHFGVYDDIQSLQLSHLTNVHIILNISGIKYMKVILPDDKVFIELENPDPHFYIVLPGTKVVFETVKGRETWGMMLKTDEIRYSRQVGYIEFLDRNQWIPAQSFMFLDIDKVVEWQLEFRKMLELFRNPVPGNIFRLRLYILNIIRKLMDAHQKNIPDNSPEAKLKELIDEDKTFTKNITELSRSCGYNIDHLRTIFYKHYKITPQNYRNQRRMATAMELITGSDLSVKEIAAKTGFKYTPYFCTAFRRTYNISPGEAVKQFRYQRKKD